MLDYTVTEQEPSSTAIIPFRGLQLMPEQFDSLKTDTAEIKEKLAYLITMHEVGQKDHEVYEQSIKRAFIRIEKLESRVEAIKDKQLSNAWISHLATAALTSAGGTIAFMLFKFGGVG